MSEHQASTGSDAWSGVYCRTVPCCPATQHILSLRMWAVLLLSAVQLDLSWEEGHDHVLFAPGLQEVPSLLFGNTQPCSLHPALHSLYACNQLLDQPTCLPAADLCVCVYVCSKPQQRRHACKQLLHHPTCLPAADMCLCLYLCSKPQQRRRQALAPVPPGLRPPPGSPWGAAPPAPPGRKQLSCRYCTCITAQPICPYTSVHVAVTPTLIHHSIAHMPKYT